MKKYKNIILSAYLIFINFYSYSLCDDKQFLGLPFDIYMSAITESPEYDIDFDYTELNTIEIPFKIHRYNIKSEINKVVVKKSLYRMYLYHDDISVKSYIISLGANPRGHKEFEGDKKTPEGNYILDYINEKSNYYKSFHISYPNKQDILHAKNLGRRPGGMIMIHGQPKYTGKKEDFVPGIQSSNWTNGCIALMNDDMDEFLNLVKPGTPITIEP